MQSWRSPGYENEIQLNYSNCTVHKISRWISDSFQFNEFPSNFHIFTTWRSLLGNHPHSNSCWLHFSSWLSLLALIGLAWHTGEVTQPNLLSKFTHLLTLVSVFSWYQNLQPQHRQLRLKPFKCHFSQGFLGRAACDSFAAKGFSTLSLAKKKHTSLVADPRTVQMLPAVFFSALWIHFADTGFLYIRHRHSYHHIFYVKPHVKTSSKALFPLFNPNIAFLNIPIFPISGQKTESTRLRCQTSSGRANKETTIHHQLKNLPWLLEYTCPSSIQVAFTSKMPGKKRPATGVSWQKNIHSKVQTIHQWSSVQQFLKCMNFLSSTPPLATIWETCSKLMVLGSKHKSSDVSVPGCQKQTVTLSEGNLTSRQVWEKLQLNIPALLVTNVSEIQMPGNKWMSSTTMDDKKKGFQSHQQLQHQAWHPMATGGFFQLGKHLWTSEIS